MEVTLKAPVGVGFPDPGFCFNPCFNGSDSKSPSRNQSVVTRICVSILVLMEVTLKADSSHLSCRTYWGFNPCFNGSDSKSFRLWPPYPGYRSFQSLF